VEHGLTTEQPQAPASALAQVTAVIVNYNSGPWLARCVRALKGKGARVPRVIVVDNASDDDSLENLPVMPELDIVRSPGNVGFGRGVNLVLDRVNTPYLLIINPDCLLAPEGLLALVADIDQHTNAALVSGRIYDMSGNEQRGSRRQLPGPRRVLNEVLRFRMGPVIDLTHLPAPAHPGEVEAVSGACMLLRTEAFVKMGGFDPGFPMHFEDLDLMARLLAGGWKIRLVPDVAISHAGGISSRRRPVQVMISKHRGLWRYLNKHCRDRWPIWVRPLWWLGIWLHATLMMPVVLWRRR